MIYDKFLEQYLSNLLITKQKAGFDQINKLMMQARKELDACIKILEIAQELAYT